MFVGHKGFAIPKASLNEVETTKLMRELTFQTPTSFLQVYRQSPNTFYVPKFYGIQRFGNVPIRLRPGLPIDLPFRGNIRENQHAAIDAFMAKRHGLLELPCGFGKTVVALHLIHRIQRKTLIIVHQEFLVTQWLERIQEFLPSARVGRIQGKHADVKDKDIVIGMLQTIVKQSFPPETYHEFGFTVIDETHHMAADVFSNALFAMVTPVMLGLSATMERKDGLSKVFKMFMGDIVYRAQREQTLVHVHKVLYRTNDPEINATPTNAKGELNYTAMLTTISNYNPRKDAILHILQHVLAMPTTKQIMMLSHQKNLLTYLHDAIVHRNLGSVGFYIGGMKPAALKESESKQMLLATYAMAQEGLDIKTLTTLILLTPKTDVTQAVGRILRTPHELPLVIDLVDSHRVFQNQWKSRMKFYESQNYVISTFQHDSYPVKRAKRTYEFIHL